MKKPLLVTIFLVSFFIPVLALAQLVPAPGCPNGIYTICDFFQMLVNVYTFIVLQIATPAAFIALVVGAIFMMVSAGNPTTFGKGREIIKWAIIGLVLAFCSYLIIDFFLHMVGFTGNWINPLQGRCC